MEPLARSETFTLLTPYSSATSGHEMNGMVGACRLFYSVRPSVRVRARSDYVFLCVAKRSVLAALIICIRSSLERGDADNHCLSRNIGGLDYLRRYAMTKLQDWWSELPI